MLAAAMARLLKVDAPAIEPGTVRAAIDTVWSSVPGHQQVSLLPWIGWAELDLAAATGRPLRNQQRLQTLLELLDATRIDAGEPDLRGGFALTAGRRPAADAQSTRPAAFVATALRQPALIPPDRRAAAIEAHRSTMRYLQQLAISDSLLWAIQTPERAEGGLRAATWDFRQPVAAQAMGLLAAAETLISLEAVDVVAEEKP
jgi:hypothetical protein